MNSPLTYPPEVVIESTVDVDVPYATSTEYDIVLFLIQFAIELVSG